ncbi:MAG: hypothetical protein ACOVK2_05110 [Candidatus Fonsibacter sp.]|jgi:hypothetical protein
MAYDKKKIYEQAKEMIVKHRLFFFDDIIAYLPISSSTFYAWEMEKSEELKELLNQNRTELKVSMRSKWYKSNAPALQMALMKLIASPEELRKLAMNHTVTEEAEKPIFNKLNIDVD